MLESEEDVQVVGDYASAEEALFEMIRLRCDIVLLGTQMPGMNWIEATRNLKRNKTSSSADVIILAESGHYRAEALKARAASYLLKDITRVELAQTIRQVYRNRQSLKECDGLVEEKVTEVVLHAMSLAVEARDPHTASHQRQVANLACKIAKEMGLPEWDIEGIQIMGLLHDVGKISVPAEILSKPGQINQYEFSIIRTHPRAGYEILNGIEFPWPVTSQVILQHHERLDGSGYPEGLSGEDIILEARILGVADVVEAMSSHRPYRLALGFDCALEEISQKRGILYDPGVVDACLRLFQKNEVEKWLVNN